MQQKVLNVWLEVHCPEWRAKSLALVIGHLKLHGLNEILVNTTNTIQTGWTCVNSAHHHPNHANWSPAGLPSYVSFLTLIVSVFSASMQFGRPWQKISVCTPGEPAGIPSW
ncbi:hypothetical protein B9Z55_015522 [Caenorhabditis nigoni]|uniref:Uncharacterized protein n=1 Tax=Caenorhabditis nigoni TaxID=1611254 RepID=A0A2G5UAM4_9PELO|nr:hypothetical protein B9Z55_015522 [Caenorhabditis nigoni]